MLFPRTGRPRVHLHPRSLSVNKDTADACIDGFYSRLYHLMQRDGIGPTALSRSLRVSESSIEHWLNGLNMPSCQNLILLSQLFNVSTDYLLGLEELPT